MGRRGSTFQQEDVSFKAELGEGFPSISTGQSEG